MMVILVVLFVGFTSPFVALAAFRFIFRPLFSRFFCLLGLISAPLKFAIRWVQISAVVLLIASLGYNAAQAAYLKMNEPAPAPTHSNQDEDSPPDEMLASAPQPVALALLALKS